MPTPVAFAAIREDFVHPPLYYFLLKAGTGIWGVGALGLRLWSLLFGMATVLAVAAIGSVLPGSRYTGLLAATLTTLNVSLIYYSQEARSYAFYTFLVMLLVLWVSAVTSKPRSAGWWITGALLMTVLVYTHYVAAVFVFYAVVAVLCSSETLQTKLRTFCCAAFAAVTLIPWLYAISGAYHAKKGLGENLDWQGHPDFAQLKQIFALSIGVIEIRGATALVLALLVLLTLSVVVFSRRSSRSVPPLLLTILLLAFLPPITIYLLSKPPVNLPLFALRHILPALPLLIIVCSYAVDILLTRSNPLSKIAGFASAALLSGIAALSAITGVREGPSRIPYDAIARTQAGSRASGLPMYTTWIYGIGEPVNFYCGTPCVSALPSTDAALPSSFTLLYRPYRSDERQRVLAFLHEGFVEESSTYYSDGKGDPWGTSAISLVRHPAQ